MGLLINVEVELTDDPSRGRDLLLLKEHLCVHVCVCELRCETEKGGDAFNR